MKQVFLRLSRDSREGSSKGRGCGYACRGCLDPEWVVCEMLVLMAVHDLRAASASDSIINCRAIDDRFRRIKRQL